MDSAYECVHKNAQVMGERLKDERDVSDSGKKSLKIGKNSKQWIRCKIALRYPHKKEAIQGKLAQKHHKAAK